MSADTCHITHEPDGAGWCCPHGEWTGEEQCAECKAERDRMVDLEIDKRGEAA